MQISTFHVRYSIAPNGERQGSQFRRVIVPVFPSRLLDRTLIYTALTRATEQVVLVGDFDAFRRAVETPPAPHRRKHGLGIATVTEAT